jgi:hypothetical protein
MRAVERRRIRLFADPGRLAGFSSDVALAQAREELRQRRDDVELRDIAQLGADSVVVALLLPPSIPDDEIAADLRSALGIGPGRYERVGGPVRGVPTDPPAACPGCGRSEGRHAPGCRFDRR